MVAALGLLLFALTGCAGRGDRAATEEARTFENPVHDANFPDPFVLRSGGAYHAYSTNDYTANVPTLRSRDLVDWTAGGDAMPDLAPWAAPGKTWAPEVLRRDDGYVLYYTAASVAAGVQCVGRAAGDVPGGPFVDRSREPLVCQKSEGGSIDASPFRDGDGSLYLYWKNDGNAIGADTHIYAQRLSGDGLRLVGERVRLFKQDAAWEGDLVEAPFMWKREGEYFMFFSANAFDSDDYATGYATCEGPLGPCRKAPENPVLRSGRGAAGPGHGAVVTDGSGRTWLAYHAWQPDSVGIEPPGRTFWLDRLVWRDGRPEVLGPTQEPQPVPE